MNRRVFVICIFVFSLLIFSNTSINAQMSINKSVNGYLDWVFRLMVMWFRLGVGSFISKKVLNDEGCSIFICNFIQIWHKQLTNDEFFSISQILNPLFEAPPQKLKEITMDLIENENVQKKIEENGNDLLLKFESKVKGVNFKFQTKLELGDGDMLYEEFILPLLLLTVKMQNREKKLIQIIKNKDAEIEEYKQENILIKKNNVKTKYFSEREFENETSSCSYALNVISNPSTFIDSIDKKLSWSDQDIKAKLKENLLLSKVEVECTSNNEKDAKQLLLNKTTSHSEDFKLCVKLDHNIIKRRKKNDSCKIRF